MELEEKSWCHFKVKSKFEKNKKKQKQKNNFIW